MDDWPLKIGIHGAAMIWLLERLLNLTFAGTDAADQPRRSPKKSKGRSSDQSKPDRKVMILAGPEILSKATVRIIKVDKEPENVETIREMRK